MTAAPPLSQLDDAFLERHYDPGSLRRGVDYAVEDRVRLLTNEPGVIDAVCRGSGSSSYVVRIRWSGTAGIVTFDDTCTCPIGEACKHCVATILTARRDTVRRGAITTRTVGDGDPGWRRSLAGLAADVDDDEPTRFGLQLAVTHPKPTRYSSTTGPQLTVRPMRWGTSGKWIKTGAAWQDLASPYGYRHTEADPSQQALIRGLMASARMPPYGSTPVAVPLAQFGPDVWQHLRRAADVGFELISDQPGTKVELSGEPARAAVDLTASETGAVRLRAGFVVDERPLELAPDRSGVLGSPVHGVWVLDGDVLHLYPMTAPLHDSVARLVAAPPLVVPAGDVDELLDVYVPSLARHAAVASADGSVSIATTRFDGLVLSVHRPTVDTLELVWSFRYRRGERSTLHPLSRPAGRVRDRDAEAAALRALTLPTHLLPGLVHLDGSPRDLAVAGPTAVRVLAEVVPWLEANTDVDVVLSGDQPTLREATGDPLISLTVHDAAERDGNDWFDLGVEVSVDGQVIDLATLFTALHRGDDALILPSGTWLRLDGPELARLRELIEEARGLVEPTGDATARVNRFQVSWFEELAALGVVAEQSARWSDSVERMATLRAPAPVPPPAGLDAELRHYQQEGLDWLVFLHDNGLGGILADDMGLGKTVQTIALCLHLLEHDPGARFLVVAPTSVVENWAHEAARFAPGVGVRTIKETAARRGSALADAIGDASIVVTSYALFRIEFDDYDALDWELLILDEAQFVKNHQGKTYQCARRLDVATKIAVTGTPLENSLMDLWSLLSITAPGLYPDPKRFSDTYRKPIERGEAPELLATLRRRIAPLLRRRTKGEVLTELPPKTEQTVEVEMSPRHARIYQTQLQRQRQKVLGLVGDVQKHRFEIFKSLTLLRQLALDPGLVDDAHDTVGSAKLDLLIDDLTQVVAEGHRALVFSQFTRYLARARTRLDAAGIAYSYLDGRTRKRDEAIARFKGGDVPVFIISLKAGGFGLNLTEADYCFVLDPWWNPAAETQAVDRAHRIGQTNPVMVYRYVSVGTIEEKVMELKARKADLFASVMDAEGALAGALTEDDIRGLLDLG